MMCHLSQVAGLAVCQHQAPHRLPTALAAHAIDAAPALFFR